MKKKPIKADQTDQKREMLMAYLETADVAAVDRLYKMLIPQDTEEGNYRVAEDGLVMQDFLTELDEAERQAENDEGLPWEETVKEIKQQFNEKHNRKR